MFVEYIFMDQNGTSTKSVRIDHNDPTMVDLIEGAVGFRFLEIVSENPQAKIDDVEFHSAISKKASNWYYNGIKMTAEEVLIKYSSDPRYSRLIKNIKEQNIKNVCVTPYGNVIKLNDEDVLISDLKSKKVK